MDCGVDHVQCCPSEHGVDCGVEQLTMSSVVLQYRVWTVVLTMSCVVLQYMVWTLSHVWCGPSVVGGVDLESYDRC